MKKSLSALLIMAVLFCGIPRVSAEEVTQDLDPMVSPDAVATVTTGGSSVNGVGAGTVSNVVSSADAKGLEKKSEVKKEEKKNKSGKKKGKAEKSSKKKSLETKNSKAHSKSSVAHSKSSASHSKKPEAPMQPAA